MIRIFCEMEESHARLQRAMTIASEIDHIFAVEDPALDFRVVETRELAGTTRGSGPAFFIARPPRPAELWSLFFGEPEDTALSDHPGYLSVVEVRPRRRGPPSPDVR